MLGSKSRVGANNSVTEVKASNGKYVSTISGATFGFDSPAAIVSVGGDLFDVRRLDENRGLVTIADISGKGIEAAVNTAFVKYSIRTLALSNADPAVILSAFNSAFLDTIKDPNLFVVAFVGILDARRRFEAQIGRGLKHQRSGKILRREAGIEVAEHDLVDVACHNAGIHQRLIGHAHDQALDGLAGKLAEGRVGPADDASSHDRSLPRLCRISVAFPWL